MNAHPKLRRGGPKQSMLARAGARPQTKFFASQFSKTNNARRPCGAGISSIFANNPILAGRSE
jgi:hypothetical protein